RVEARFDRLADRVALEKALERGDAVARQHRAAVVEYDAVAQPHGPAPPAVLDQIALEHERARVELLVAPVESLVDHIGEVAGHERGGPHRIEAREIGLGHVNDGAALSADRRLGKRAPGARKRRRGADHECAAMHMLLPLLRRSNAPLARLCHCERSDAIQRKMDCFVALRAPRNDGGYSGLISAKAITFAHFSVCSARNLAKSAGLIGKTTPPRSAKRSCIFASARPALISALSIVTISAGVFFGAPRPYHVSVS